MLLTFPDIKNLDDTDKTAAQFVELGFGYFDRLMESNLISDLKNGIYNFVRAYELDNAQLDVITRFDEVFYLPVTESININYSKNIKHFCNNDNSYLPSTEELHIYPINDDDYFAFNLSNHSFLYYGKWDNTDYIASRLMIDSIECLEQDDFFISTLNFVKILAANRHLARGITKALQKENLEKLEPLLTSFDKSYSGGGIVDFCNAQYYYAMHQYEKALEYACLSLKANRLSPQTNFLTAKILLELNDNLKSVFFAFRSVVADENYTLQALDLLKAVLKKENPCQKDAIFSSISLAITAPCFFPRYTQAFLDNDNNFETNRTMLPHGFFDVTPHELPCFKTQSDSQYKYITANLSSNYRQLNSLLDETISAIADISLLDLLKKELVKFTETSACEITHEGIDFVLPVLSNTNQYLNISCNGTKKPLTLFGNTIEYLRITKSIFLNSAISFYVGKPIPLVHSPKRKKLVANIFIDSLSMDYLVKTHFKDAPNIKRFFDKGIMFANTYSTAEHTIPSLPSIKTGTYPHKTQIFERDLLLPLDENIKLFADYFAREGYYCSSFTGNMEEPYFDTIRSMERVVCQCGYNYPIQNIVSDALIHLRAFSETDNYIELCIDTPHRILENVQKDLELQIKEPVESIICEDEPLPSVWQPKSSEKELAYSYAIKHTDTELSRFFDYVNATYNSNEFVVTVFSDHGISITDSDIFLLKKSQTNSSFFIRGGNNKLRGVNASEIVSSLDILPSVLNACNILPAKSIDGVLPRAFGGSGRAYAITQSVFSGQTYKIVIRTLEYEFRFEGAAFTTFDGHIDTEHGEYTLRDNKNNLLYGDFKIIEYFLNIVQEHTKTRLLADAIN